jgi:SAM-dependent methyltransferase
VSAPDVIGRAALNAVHQSLVFNRRIRVLAEHLSELVQDGDVLDMGCGDGSLALEIMARRPGVSIVGVDVFARTNAHIPVTEFDGNTLPFETGSFDHVMLIDVLHHTDDPAAVLTEAARVARRGVLVKDHLLEGAAAGATLRLMDWVGNRGHGVRLPYNYLDRPAWDKAFAAAGLGVDTWRDRLSLYPAPAAWLFDRKLHFIATLSPRG